MSNILCDKYNKTIKNTKPRQFFLTKCLLGHPKKLEGSNLSKKDAWPQQQCLKRQQFIKNGLLNPLTPKKLEHTMSLSKKATV